MSGTDPLSLLLGKKKEEEAKKPTAAVSPAHKTASTSSAHLGDVDDVFGSLSKSTGPRPVSSSAATSSLFGSGPPLETVPSRASGPSSPGAGASTSLFGEDDPFKANFATTTTSYGGYPSASSSSYGGSSLPTATATTLGRAGTGEALGPGPGEMRKRDEAKAAIGGALTNAFSAVNSLLKNSGGTSSTSPAVGTVPGQGLAALASPAFKAGIPPSQAQYKTTTFEDILPGETVHAIMKECFLVVTNPLMELRGRLLATNYRLKFQTQKGVLRPELQWMRAVSYYDVPLGAIEDIKPEQSTSAAGVTEYKLKVSTKDLRTLLFVGTEFQDWRSIQEIVARLGVPGNSTLLFAVAHAQGVWNSVNSSQEVDGWSIYKPNQEYARQGIPTDPEANPDCPWKISRLNVDYGLCATYPAILVVPKAMSDNHLWSVARFRKRGRFPAMSWCGGRELDYASLWRCSQTTEGLMGSKCFEDYQFVESIRQGGRGIEGRDLLVIDLRPWKSAWANKAGGGGFENGHAKCRLVFGGIDNIHAVRDAWRAMGNAVANVSDGDVGSWFKDMANSCWYDYIGAILSSTHKVVKEILDHKSNVMVHCSDGWDRTAQVSSLSMLCLDAYYRTQEGFAVLIQKEWCSFGHRFRTRLALGEAPTGEYSPVFIQWLECVYQLVKQAPQSFEFTPGFLLRLANEVVSNRYGTFLCDCEQDRQQKVAADSISFWSVVLRAEDRPTWQNPDYQPTKAMVPNITQADYVVWDEYWWRFHPRGQQMASIKAAYQTVPPPLVAPAASSASATSPSAAAAAPTTSSTSITNEAPSPPPMGGAEEPPTLVAPPVQAED